MPQESEPTANDDWLAEGVPVVQLSLFPTEQAQIRQIAESEQLSAFSMPQSDIDHILRTGGNQEDSTLRVCIQYQKCKTTEENAAFLQREYGEGGKGFLIGGEKVSVWFNADGIHLAKGDSALYARSKQLITWEQAEQRIGELLIQGQYLPQAAIATTNLYERQQAAQNLWYLHQDFADSARDMFFDEAIFKGGFPSSTAHIAELLAQPQEFEKLLAGLKNFAAAYEQNHEHLRFGFHRPAELLVRFADLQLPRREFTAEITNVPPLNMFITQDELDSVIATGSYKLEVYEFFTQHHAAKEKGKFIRDKHGIGGGGGGAFYRAYDGKGFTYTRGDLLNPDAKAVLSWSQMAKRIETLIADDHYLTADEKIQLEERRNETVELTDMPIAAPVIAEFVVETTAPVIAVPVTETIAPTHTPPIATPPYVPSEITQGNIDTALQNWNGEITSKHTVIRHLEKHARERGTADFLRTEFGGNRPAFTVTKGETALELPWAKVQRRIAQLITEDRFYTETERDNMDDVDPVAIRERLESGEGDAFVSQVLADVERLAEQEPTEPEPETAAPAEAFPYAVGETVYLENGVPFIIEEVSDYNIRLRDPSLFYPVTRAESKDSFLRLMGQYPQPTAAAPKLSKPDNFHITDVHLGEGSSKIKYQMNVAAIRTLQTVEKEGRYATPDEQEILSKYVGWGGVSQAFDKDNGSWGGEYSQLKALLSEDEYSSARASTLNAHYTSPTVIKAIYDTVEKMGFSTGNILEPACGTGNFFGLLPESMAQSKLYGVEVDSITGRIAGQLYPHADIAVSGFEHTNYPDNFFDLVVGNVPFGDYKVLDKKYDKYNFLIHDYFFAKAVDKARAGGIVALITSNGISGGTLDKKDSRVRRHLAQRCDLLGAIRLPNNAFKANAGTELTTDIVFLQKRDTPRNLSADMPDWVETAIIHESEHVNSNGETRRNFVSVNRYFEEHPQMALGELNIISGPFGPQLTCAPKEAELSVLLEEAIQHIEGKITEVELPDMDMSADTSIPADPAVKNFSYTLVDGEVYYRENSRMVRPALNDAAKERVVGLVELKNCVHALMDFQLEGVPNYMTRHQIKLVLRFFSRFVIKLIR